MKYTATLATRITVDKSNGGDKDRHATFIASSKNLDRDGETVELESLKILKKDGSAILVKDVSADGITEVDIPLTLNHSFDVNDVIGSVDKVMFDAEKGELIFDARFSSREKAQDIYKLLEEGHLTNAFSISAFDVDRDNDGKVKNGTLHAVGLVERGANADARLLSVKSAEKSTEENTTTKDGGTAKEDEQQPEAKTEDETTNETEGKTEDDKSKDDAEETNAEDESEGTEGEEESEENETEGEDADTSEKPTDDEGDNAMDKKVAKALVKEPTQEAKVTSTAEKSYLDSKLAMHDFSRLIATNKGMSSATIMSMWGNKLAEKGIDGDIAKLPTPLVTIFKGWEDHSEILATLRRSGRATRTVFAFTGEGATLGEAMRAKGHTKGQKKSNQAPYLYARDLKGKLIYKKLPIDLQDLLDDTTGELSLMRTEELLARIDSEAERAVVVGDGRSAGTPDYRIFDAEGRGIHSMAADVTKSAGQGTTSDDYYAKAVATALENVSTDNIYDKIKKTVARVAGRTKYVVVAPGLIADLETQKADNSGVYLFPNGVQLGQNVVLFERDWMTGSGFDVIAYVGDKYELYYGNSMIRTDFDIDYNLDVMLAERYASGSAKGYKAVAGYESES